MTDFEAKYKQQADRAHDLANQCQVLMNEKYLLEASNKELLDVLEFILSDYSTLPDALQKLGDIAGIDHSNELGQMRQVIEVARTVIAAAKESS